jgi:hypothetical protein
MLNFSKLSETELQQIDLTKLTETELMNYGVRANGIEKRNKWRIGNEALEVL